MDERAYETARQRKCGASANAIGLLSAVAENGAITPGGIVRAREIVAEWNAAHADEGAALDAPNREAA
jgi:hypothetical protein